MSIPPKSILVVASWYPSIDGLATGRFVADQVGALRDAGRFLPLVASFDPLATWGSGGLRKRERFAIRSLGAAGAERVEAVFRAGSTIAGAPGPVARLPVPAPGAGSSAADAIADRVAALEAAAPAVAAMRGEFAIVHAHTGLPDGVAAARFAGPRGIPLILTEHSSTLPAIAADPARRALYAEALAASRTVIAVSEALAADIRAIEPSVAARLRVVANVVAVHEFTAPPIAARAADELLFVGFRKPGKGIGLLLDAFARARATRPGLRLRLVGAPGSREDDRAWRARAAGLGIEDAVLFEPEADRAGVAAAMARAVAFVHPSSRETFGVVAAEALASGLPVVAVDSGGVTEILGAEPDRYGRVVPKDDPVALAAAILDVLDRRHEFPPAVLRQRAVDRFGADAIAGTLMQIYEAALEERGRRGPHHDAHGLVDEPAAVRDRTSPTAWRSGAAPAPAHQGAADRSPLILIGSDRRRAARVLAAMPAAERSRVTLVTADDPAIQLPADLAGILVVDGLAARHAARRGVLDVPGADPAARRRSLWRRPSIILRELVWRAPRRERALVGQAVAAATRAVGTAADATVVALDGFDALIAFSLVQHGSARPAPGAGRWLADDRDAGALEAEDRA